MPRRKGRLRDHGKIGWQFICPTCVKYEHHDHSPDCEICRQHGVTENILCALTRMDQEDDLGDFRCGAYEPKQPLQ